MKQLTQKPSQVQADISHNVLLGISKNVASGDGVGSASAPHAPLAASDADRDSGHPCLTSNNSIRSVNIRVPDGSVEDNFNKFKEWKEEISPKLSGYQWKCSNRMQTIIQLVAEHYGQNSIACLDLTFSCKDPSYDYANTKLNSFMTNVFRPRYGKNYMVVCERGGKNGKIHYHILFVKSGADFRTGSRKQIVKGGRDRGRINFYPNEACRKEFDFLKPILKGYGFGGWTRVAPLWDIGKGAKYFSKYIGKGHYNRSEEMRGRQLVRYGAGFSKYCSMKFSKVEGVSAERRNILAMLGGRYGCINTDELKEKFGSRWQYYSGDQMRYLCDVSRLVCYPNQIEWVELYLWNRYKFKLIWVDRGGGECAILGAYKYQIKQTHARQYVGSTSLAPDDVFERTGILDKVNLVVHAWRELILKIEMDQGGCVALDSPPKPIIVEIKNNGLPNNKRIRTDSGKDGGTDEVAQLSLVGFTN